MSEASRTVEHIGEWKVEFQADTVEGIFREVARLIAGTLGARPLQGEEWERVDVPARTLPTLLVDWANEILGRSEAAGRAYEEIRDLRIRPGAGGLLHLSAEVRGRAVDDWTSPLKAATYHAPELVWRDGCWHATLLFDI